MMSARVSEWGYPGQLTAVSVGHWHAPQPNPLRVALVGHIVEDLPDVPPEITRVLIVAQDPLVRGGLAALLADQPDCFVVGQAAPDADLVAALETAHPDVVVWDGGRGQTLPEQLADLGEGPPVLLLLPSDTTLAGVAAEGVRGCLSRDTDSSSVVAALKAITRGLMVFDPAFVRGPLSPKSQDTGTLTEELTSRESEVLQLLAAGLSNKTIAERLAISEHTVKFHINAIYGKLDAHSRTEAVTRAARLGLIVL